MPDPVKELLVRNDPDVRLLLSPIQEVVNHLDGGVGRIDSGIGRGKMDGMGVQSNGLTHVGVMRSERILHVSKGC